ncbi:hypothetical protein TRVL_06315 [Trypanosoma vivax]|nr:hypothetical protein TRVL_06315 [Trypanosoma vivax]
MCGEGKRNTRTLQTHVALNCPQVETTCFVKKFMGMKHCDMTPMQALRTTFACVTLPHQLSINPFPHTSPTADVTCRPVCDKLIYLQMIPGCETAHPCILFSKEEMCANII